MYWLLLIAGKENLNQHVELRQSCIISFIKLEWSYYHDLNKKNYNKQSYKNLTNQ